MDLKNKVVLVTGSSLGIGRETAFKFAKEGCKVAVTYYKTKRKVGKQLKNALRLGLPMFFFYSLM